MDNEKDADIKLLCETIKKFSDKEIVPLIFDIEKNEDIPQALIDKMASQGLFGMPFPSAYGGYDLDYHTFTKIVEIISTVDASVALTILAHTLCTNHIFTFGDTNQKDSYLPSLISGKTIGAWALSEPSSGSDTGSIKTQAKKSGKDWVLNGQKLFTTNGDRAGTYVIMAKTDAAQNTHGISAFIVEKKTPGLAVGKRLKKLGFKGSDTVELFLDNVKIPDKNLIGEKNKGFQQTMEILDAGRIGISALAIGIAQASLNASIQYAKERTQFGKHISEFQAIDWMLAEMATDISASKHLLNQAVALKTQKKRYTKEASMAKLFSSSTAMSCSNKAVQIHGGYGYITEYKVEKYYRDAKLCEIGEGTSEMQKIIIARELLR